MSPSEPPDGSFVETVFAEPPHRFPNVATCPIVGTLVLEVSVVAIAEPTAPSVTFVTVSKPAAVVFKTFSFVALPSATASANLITCENEPVIPALQ